MKGPVGSLTIRRSHIRVGDGLHERLHVTGWWCNARHHRLHGILQHYQLTVGSSTVHTNLARITVRRVSIYISRAGTRRLL